MSDATLVLRFVLQGTEHDRQHGTMEVGIDTDEGRETLARFADRQPITLNGRTFLVTGYEIVALQMSGPPAGWQPDLEPVWTNSTVFLTVPDGHGGLYMLGDGTLRRIGDE